MKTFLFSFFYFFVFLFFFVYLYFIFYLIYKFCMNVRTLVRCHWSRLSQMLLSSTPLPRLINGLGVLPILWMACASSTFLLVICCSSSITVARQRIACVVSSTCSTTADFFAAPFLTCFLCSFTRCLAVLDVSQI